jgi:hypothetical protein
VRDRSSRTKIEAQKFVENLADYTGIEPSYHSTYDKYKDSFLDEDYEEEEDWWENEYTEEDDESMYRYISQSRPNRTIGDELFALISKAEDKQSTTRETNDAMTPAETGAKEDVAMDSVAVSNVETQVKVDGMGSGADGLPKACNGANPNSLMGVPTKWYPKGEAVYLHEKKRNISSDSQDSGINLGSNSSLQSLDATPVQFYEYQPPNSVSCSVPFSDIQPTSLSEAYGNLFMEGESLPRKFSIQIPGSAIGVKPAEAFVLFEETDICDGALDFSEWSELDELFTNVRFHVLGNFEEFAKDRVSKELAEVFKDKKQLKLADVIDKIVDILRSLPNDR